MKRIGLALWLGTALLAHGAPPRSGGEVFGIFGTGKLFRFEDQGFGSRPTLGGGVGYRFRWGLGVELEALRTAGFEVRPVPCALPVPCTGSGRSGVESAAVVGSNASYSFGRSSRVQPYVTGGAGILRSKGFSTIIEAGPSEAVIREMPWTDTGMAINFGFGLRIFASSRFSIRPELRFYNATAMSRANLSFVRFGLAASWHW